MKFWKMHGSGNDFVVTDDAALSSKTNLPEIARRLCHRHFGIGADGLIVLLSSHNADIRMRIINSDGSEAEMCGNGIRCLARFAFEKGISKKSLIAVETLAGVIKPELIMKDGVIESIRVDMGIPRAPYGDSYHDGLYSGGGPFDRINAGGKDYEVTRVSMGNPHAVIFVNRVDSVVVGSAGPAIEIHPLFPEKTNVEFVEIVDGTALRVKVWERGAGETLACGTGACASLVAAAMRGLSGRRATVSLPGGDLIVEWKEDGSVFLTGPAEKVFEGEVNDL